MKRRAQALVAFGSGLLFGAGLALSGMTQPSKVIGFLDVMGAWDASLMLVMGGAIAAYATAFRLAPKQPRFAQAFDLPTRRDIDARLVIGAALFGIGWGLGGLCPGPSLVALPSGRPSVLVFVLAMGCGMLLVERLAPRLRKTRTTIPRPRHQPQLEPGAQP